LDRNQQIARPIQNRLGQQALKEAWLKLKDDPVSTMRVYGAFFPEKLRNTIKDVMAAEGITFKDLKEMIVERVEPNLTKQQ
jgi:hypothetical protein